MAAHGEESLEAVTLRDCATATGERVAGRVFIFIGASPNTDWLGDQVARDPRGLHPGRRPSCGPRRAAALARSSGRR